MQTFILKKTLVRNAEIYQNGDPNIPAELYGIAPEKPDVSSVNYPLPTKKSDYTCFCKTENALWLGADNGLTRYCENAEYDSDVVMFFSADRYLEDNRVLAVMKDSESENESVWVLTEKGASHITLSNISLEEKAEILTEETLKYVSRRGMVTQRELSVSRELETRVPYGHSDNSGCFTAGFAIGELCKYAVYREKYGANSEKTTAAKKSAVKATEACQLLMNIHGRGDGFIARTYMVPTEPIPDDGLFYKKIGDKAVCIPTSFSKRRGLANKVIDASHPVPERLARLYTDEGYTGEGIVYKGDTSSDEITLHFMLIYFAHEILGEEDPELDEIVKTSAKNTLEHILRNGYEFYECDGKPTTWAKWSLEYFNTPLGWSDACLNATELLMYHKIVMHITGERGKWEESYNHLAYDLGYARLTTLHDTRFHISAGSSGVEQVEDLMYGDHMLATAAYWMLITLEDNPKLKEMYRMGYKGWNGTFRREHNPAYDFPFMLACPDEEINTEMLSEWFRRQNISRLCSSVSPKSRHDVPLRYRFGGTKETGWLLPPDENFISKYDRNPYDYREGDYPYGKKVLESCYVYTFAYWFGRYFGFIKED